MSRKPSNIQGITFGRLTALEPCGKDSSGYILWKFQCICGNVIIRNSNNIKRGHTKSCGCQYSVAAKKRALKAVKLGVGGVCRTKLRAYSSWHSMMQRCYFTKHPYFKNYGGRGIAVCSAWHTFDGFLKDMGECPVGMSLGRKKHDDDYDKTNCSWETREQQGAVRRTNRYVEYGGKVFHLAALSRKLNMPYGHLRYLIDKNKFPQVLELEF